MRNLKEYPITFDESLMVLSYLKNQEISKEQYGSVVPHVLSLLEKYINENKDGFDNFLKENKIS